MESEALRRRIHTQLNKGEALNELRCFLVFEQCGVIRKKSGETLADQAPCLSLLTNAVVVWNTLYTEAASDRLASEGTEIRDEDLARLSPARSAHIGRCSRCRFDLEGARRQSGLRPLREPKG